MLRGDEVTRQRFRRAELLRRLDLRPARVVSLRRLHVPIDGYRLDIDGASLDLRLLWPPASTPVRLSALQWREGLAWELRIVDARDEVLRWYAWSLRIR